MLNNKCNTKTITAMKKIIILWILMSLFCVAYAQGPGTGYPCPSSLYLEKFHKTGKAHKFRLYLMLDNESQNLNGFNLKLSKSDPSIKWVMVDKENGTFFSTMGYAKNILARLWGKTDEELEEEFEQYCEVKSHNGNDGRLTIIEILSLLPNVNEYLFFPVGYDIAVGELAVDLSDCEDGEYIVSAETMPLDYSFSYTGGVEGTCGWVADYPLQLVLYKQGDLVSIFPWFPMDDYDGVVEVENAKSVASVKYFNLVGVESSEPQDGVSIKVTTYSDGTRTTEKIFK